MKWKNVQKLPEKQFRRITGVMRKTFEKMIEIVTAAEKIKKANGGRPNVLCVEDRILMTLEYLREYRTYAHIAASYGLGESNVFNSIRWIEDVLIKSKEFSLPGKKALLKSENEYEVILVDATESPIERPKKNSNISIQEKRKSTL